MANITKASFTVLLFLILVATTVSGVGVNWGTYSSHPLSPEIMVDMIVKSGFHQVKLFEVDHQILKAIGRRGQHLEVTIGIPNDMLFTLADSVEACRKWVSENVTTPIESYGVQIKFVAVGNEPFLSAYNGRFLNQMLPALGNVQYAIIDAGYGEQVKATIPINADVLSSTNGLPSGTIFRADVADQLLGIVRVLKKYGSAFFINIYPFLSLIYDPNSPIEYAFFDGAVSPVKDGDTLYSNNFEATFDGLVSALESYGFGDLPIVVGEVGWPTDGQIQATLNNSRRFSQGLVNALIEGTPKRPGMIDAFIFSLIDEDQKSLLPGNFERHWGLYTFDGQPKYSLTLGTTELVPAQGVVYEGQKWCILKPDVQLNDSRITPSVNYACSKADCTGDSCANLEPRLKVSYALNSYYQSQDQDEVACDFQGIGAVITADPSTRTCKFNINILPADSRALSLNWVVQFSLIILYIFIDNFH